MPHVDGAWLPTAQLISRLLSELDTPVMPSWNRLRAAITPVQTRPVLASRQVYPALSFVTATLTDVTTLADAATRLRQHRSSVRPEEIGHLVRVAAVLQIDLGPDGDILREWGADGPVFMTPPYPALTAHWRIAARIYATWRTAFAHQDGTISRY